MNWLSIMAIIAVLVLVGKAFYDRNKATIDRLIKGKKKETRTLEPEEMVEDARKILNTLETITEKQKKITKLQEEIEKAKEELKNYDNTIVNGVFKILQEKQQKEG